MVQITHARIRDEATGEPVKISAAAFDKKSDGKKLCLCPDEHCGAVLTHYKSYMQTYYDLQTGEPYKLKIPAHFKRVLGGPAHSESCTAVDAYTIYQNYARDIGGLSQQHGAFVYNLNIMTDNRPAPLRHARDLSSSFGSAHGRVEGVKKRASVRMSEGLNHVRKLAGLLDRTEFDKHYRDSILLRDGGKRFTLADLYEDDSVRLFREAHARAKSGAAPTPLLLQFKPIVLAKFHSKKELTIQGQPVAVRGGDGNDYFVSVKLHCGSKNIYDSVKQGLRSGERSFLLYAKDARVDLIEFAHKKKEIQDGRAQDRAVFVHVRVDRPEQLMAWKPHNGQLDLEVAGMELPVQHKPPREIPQQLIG